MDERPHDGERTVSGADCCAEPALRSVDPSPEAEPSDHQAEKPAPVEVVAPGEPLLPRAAGGGAGAVAALAVVTSQPACIEAVHLPDSNPHPIAPAHASAPDDQVSCEAEAPLPVEHALPSEPEHAGPPPPAEQAFPSEPEPAEPSPPTEHALPAEPEHAEPSPPTEHPLPSAPEHAEPSPPTEHALPAAPEHAEPPLPVEHALSPEPEHAEPPLPAEHTLPSEPEHVEPARAQPPLLELIPDVLPTPPRPPTLSPSVASVLRTPQIEPLLDRDPDAPFVEPVAPPPEPPPPPGPSPAYAPPANAILLPPPSPAVTLPLPSRAWPTAGRRHLRLAARIALTLLAAIAILMLALLVLYRWIDPPASTLMLGQRLAGTSISQRWVALDRISPNLHHAVILSEDGHFCRHSGVDWGELKEAIESAGDGMARGGSTISMQVVKNLFLWPSRSYLRKALEIPLAYAIEALWPKRRIFEIYLNIAEWRPGIFGAEAAARYHFRKSALLLTPREAALLAVSLPNPFERQAGRPGPGTVRLADNLLLRMRTAQANMACVRTGPDTRASRW